MSNVTQKTEWVDKDGFSQTAMFEATIGKVTKEFKVTKYNSNDDKAFTDHVFTARIGQGSKIHPTSATMWFKDGEWILSYNPVVLNRTARIIGWREVREGTSQHVGSQYPTISS